MNVYSVRSRFLGSYVFIICLLMVQIPIVYFLVGGMTRKFSQVNEAGELRKRAVELSYILNRHILNGEEDLEKVFQQKKEEYTGLIEGLMAGTREVDAIKDAEVKAKLDGVKDKWAKMKNSLDEAMESGDELSVKMRDIENTTYPMVEKLNGITAVLEAENDPSYAKSISAALREGTRTVNLAYLMERYARANYDLPEVSSAIRAAVTDFEADLQGLRNGSQAQGIKAVRDKEIAERLDEVEALWTRRKALINDGMRLKDAFYAELMEVGNVHTPAIVGATDGLVREIAVSSNGSAMTGVLILGASVFASVSLGIFFVWSTNHHIINPLIRVKETVESFTEGNLTTRAGVRVSFLGREINDEITGLGRSVDEMASQMSKVIGSISDSSNLLASASEELSASSRQIEEGANKQSGETSQVAKAMEEMNATVIEVAKNSQQVSESAKGAEDLALNGGEVVRQAIDAMQEVSRSTALTAETIKRLGRRSEEIGTIISVINDIADQTNLLALNAAIEAARAGELGRGFAVVADEVRKLAERTTKATKEISGMINSIQEDTGKAVEAMAEGTKKVENGVRLANEAGGSLTSILGGVQNVSDMIRQIATSTEQQSSTTDEISRNMDSIAEVAKGNVKTIAEVSNSSGEMARLATELKELVTEFRIAEGSSGAEVVSIGGRTRTPGRAGEGLQRTGTEA